MREDLRAAIIAGLSGILGAGLGAYFTWDAQNDANNFQVISHATGVNDPSQMIKNVLLWDRLHVIRLKVSNDKLEALISKCVGPGPPKDCKAIAR